MTDIVQTTGEERKGGGRPIIRAFDILRALNQRSYATLHGLWDDAGLPKTTIHRILATLCEQGYVARDPLRGVYRLTAKVQLLSAGYTERSRITYGVKPDPNQLQREAIDSVPEGSVVVMDCRRDGRAASAGDVYVTRLKVRGVAGMVSDGGLRDSAAIARMNLPVFCAGPSAPSNRILHRAVDYNLPIGCGGVAVYPGDIIVGDADGVAVVPRNIVDEVAADSAEQERLEGYIQQRVASGEPLQGVYLVNERTRAEYAAWKAVRDAN